MASEKMVDAGGHMNELDLNSSLLTYRLLNLKQLSYRDNRTNRITKNIVLRYVCLCVFLLESIHKQSSVWPSGCRFRFVIILSRF